MYIHIFPDPRTSGPGVPERRRDGTIRTRMKYSMIILIV